MAKKPKVPKAQAMGMYIARRMANRKPLTKPQMLRAFPKLGSIHNINMGIDWIEDNTSLSENSFLMVIDNGRHLWGFRRSFGEVKPNLVWNYRYLRTRMQTTQTVLTHTINSPVVSMTPKERRLAKAIAAQAGGVVAYLDQMIRSMR